MKAPPKSQTYPVTPARRSDLNQIMEIEHLSFSNPWPRQVFREEFDNELSFVKVLRDRDSDRVIAFINYWLVHDEIHLLNIATHPDWRRRKLARRLIAHLLRVAKARRSRLITLEVRRSNHPAINLYDDLGFLPVGIRPRYYENNEDAIVMMLNLDQS